MKTFFLEKGRLKLLGRSLWSERSSYGPAAEWRLTNLPRCPATG